MRRLTTLFLLIVLTKASAASELVGELPNARVSYEASITLADEKRVKVMVHYTPGSILCPRAYRYDLSEEGPNSEVRQNMIFVDREGRESSWTAFPDRQTHMAYGSRASFMLNKQDLEFRLEGTEVIAGYSTRRFSISGAGQRSGQIWLTEDDVPVRVIATSPHGDTLENFRWDLIEVRDVSCSKFDVPDGYRRLRPVPPPEPG